MAPPALRSELRNQLCPALASWIHQAIRVEIGILILDQRLAVRRQPLVVELVARFNLLSGRWVDKCLAVQRKQRILMSLIVNGCLSAGVVAHGGGCASSTHGVLLSAPGQQILIDLSVMLCNLLEAKIAGILNLLEL